LRQSADIKDMDITGERFNDQRLSLREKLATVPEIRTNVVNALQKAIKNGTYRVRDEAIADSLCRELCGPDSRN
jgi:anti-sigma28 factor (negative regulator of flagellin synthesis)